MSCGANVRIGFWIELSGSAAAARRVARELLGALGAHGHAELPVERDRVAVGERERRRVGAAGDAAHGGLADPLDPRLGPLQTAARADRQRSTDRR